MKLFDYMLCQHVKILDFDSLVVKCCIFYIVMVLECYVIELYELYANDENCMKLMSYIWEFDGILSMKCLCLIYHQLH